MNQKHDFDTLGQQDKIEARASQSIEQEDIQ